jgi:inositol transporter-like SP family MFS transporter
VGQRTVPARYRASAQGVLFFSARIFLGLWSLCLPVINEAYGFKAAAVFLVIFATISMLIGTIFNPDTAGKTLEKIEEERYGSVGGK